MNEAVKHICVSIIKTKGESCGGTVGRECEPECPLYQTLQALTDNEVTTYDASSFCPDAIEESVAVELATMHLWNELGEQATKELIMEVLI